MSQMQYRASEGESTEATGSPHNLNDCKDKATAKFVERAPMVVNPEATGDGPKNNPGIPADSMIKSGVEKR